MSRLRVFRGTCAMKTSHRNPRRQDYSLFDPQKFKFLVGLSRRYFVLHTTILLTQDTALAFKLTGGLGYVLFYVRIEFVCRRSALNSSSGLRRRDQKKPVCRCFFGSIIDYSDPNANFTRLGAAKGVNEIARYFGAVEAQTQKHQRLVLFHRHKTNSISRKTHLRVAAGASAVFHSANFQYVLLCPCRGRRHSKQLALPV